MAADDTTILGQWTLGVGAVGAGDVGENHYWLPTAKRIAAFIQTETKINQGWGADAENFTGATKIKGSTVDELIYGISGEVALIGGTAPSEILGEACKLATVYGVCMNVEASLDNNESNRDWHTERYDSALKNLRAAVANYEHGDEPGADARGAGASSIPRFCPGPASVAW